jgi:tetratricopeptide (TPR) repeat protein
METLKQEGNDAFKAGKYKSALELYSKAIAVEENAVLYSNRSATQLKLKDAAAALKDADKCIQLDPEWQKGYFRKGQALEAQGALDQVSSSCLPATASSRPAAVPIPGAPFAPCMLTHAAVCRLWLPLRAG